MIPGEHDKVFRCERCDAEASHVVESIGDDNRLHHVCWDCVGRDEKRFNQKPGWRRAHRTRRYEALSEPRLVGVAGGPGDPKGS